MTLAAHEDKTFRGGYIASPSMPWVWGTGLENPSGAYHLVWSRDLYQIATALIAGRRPAGANRAVDYLFEAAEAGRLVPPELDGRRHGALDQPPARRGRAADRARVAARARAGRRRYSAHIKKAADFIVNFPDAPFTPQERWENQSGYSPGTIASEIAGLVCAADIARRTATPRRRSATCEVADDWQARSRAGPPRAPAPTRAEPYYLRLTKDGNPNAGTTYNIGDSGPGTSTSARSSTRASSSSCASA